MSHTEIHTIKYKPRDGYKLTETGKFNDETVFVFFFEKAQSDRSDDAKTATIQIEYVYTNAGRPKNA